MLTLMRYKEISFLAWLFLAITAASPNLTGCSKEQESPLPNQLSNPHAELEAAPRGPHSGRLLTDGDFKLEVTIFETGAAPTFRVYGFKDGVPITPSELAVEISLTRLGGQIERFILHPVGELLSSKEIVHEPHSFNVSVTANYSGAKYTWSYPSFENRTTISKEIADHSGITAQHPQAREIPITRRIRGKILPSEHMIAHIIPRFSGIVREGRKHIGDKVEKGEVLAIIESNQSLQPFEVRSQIAGTVINGHLIVGEYVPENQWVYIVADLSEVWADLFVPLQDRESISVGQRIRIALANEQGATEATISYLAPYADERSQAQLVRAVIPNPRGEFLPGVFITGDVVIERRTVSLAVRREALQRFQDWEVVFIKYAEIYEARPVKTGVSDGEWVEIIDGLTASDEYVVGNSFLVKADILKSGASHDH